MIAAVGTGRLTRFSLRLVRIRVATWAIALGMITWVIGIGFNRLYPTAASRHELGKLAGSPVLRAMLGPLLAPTLTGGLIAWREGAVLVVVLSLATTFLVVQRTRGEEQSGRAAVIAACPVGRSAAALSSIQVAAALDALTGFAIALALVSLSQPVADSIWFGLGIALIAWCFGTFAALAAQVLSSSKAANGCAAGAIAVGYLLLALGQLRESWLIWITPIGWLGEIRAFADPRAAVLLLPLGAGVLVTGAVAWLASVREHGRGLRAEPRARLMRPVRSVAGLAWRLEQVVASITMVVALAYSTIVGSLVGYFRSFAASSPEFARAIERLGGTHVLEDGFTTFMMLFGGLAMAGWGVSLMLRLHAEEESGRSQFVLASGASRKQVFGGFAVAAMASAVAGTILWGIGLGIGRALVDHRIASLWRSVGAGLVTVPAVTVVVATAALLVGLGSRYGVLAWMLVVWCAMVTVLGAFFDAPQLVKDVSPFTHVPAVPLPAGSWVPCLVLLAVGALLLAGGLAAYVRRSISGS
jgi:ABC-2 type transport system permease protein